MFVCMEMFVCSMCVCRVEEEGKNENERFSLWKESFVCRHGVYEKCEVW